MSENKTNKSRIWEEFKICCKWTFNAAAIIIVTAAIVGLFYPYKQRTNAEELRRHIFSAASETGFAQKAGQQIFTGRHRRLKHKFPPVDAGNPNLKARQSVPCSIRYATKHKTRAHLPRNINFHSPERTAMTVSNRKSPASILREFTRTGRDVRIRQPARVPKA